jgi:hypothetical protein
MVLQLFGKFINQCVAGFRFSGQNYKFCDNVTNARFKMIVFSIVVLF